MWLLDKYVFRSHRNNENHTALLYNKQGVGGASNGSDKLVSFFFQNQTYASFEVM